MVENIRIGDLVQLRKVHPCGGFEWEVIRIGADIKTRCLGCGRYVMMSRSALEKRVKTVDFKRPVS